MNFELFALLFSVQDCIELVLILFQMNGEILHLVNLSLELFASYLITNSVSLIVIVFFKWFISCWVIYGSLWFLRKWFISSKWSKLIYSCLQYFVIFLLRAVGSVVIYSLLFLIFCVCFLFKWRMNVGFCQRVFLQLLRWSCVFSSLICWYGKLCHSFYF